MSRLFPALIAVSLLALLPVEAVSQTLKSGPYLVDMDDLELVGDVGDGDQIRQDAAQYIGRLDSETRELKMYFGASDKADIATFSEDYTLLEAGPGTSFSVELIADDRFAINLGDGTDSMIRMVLERVEEDSPELAAAEAAKAEILREEAEQREAARARLRAAYDDPQPLDIRVNLPGGQASIALPAALHIEGSADYLTIKRHAGSRSRPVSLVVLPEGSDSVEIFQQESASFALGVEDPLMIDGRMMLGDSIYGGSAAIAMTEIDGTAIMMRATTDEMDLSTILSIWQSLGPPVEHAIPLRPLEGQIPEAAVGADEFDTRIASLLNEMHRSGALLEQMDLRPDDVFAGFAPKLPLGTDGAPDQMEFEAGVYPGPPAEVLKRFAPAATDDNLAIVFQAATCRTHAAIPLAVEGSARPMTLILRQSSPLGSYASCLDMEQVLKSYDPGRARRLAVPASFVDQIGQYSSVRATALGDFVVGDGKQSGVLKPDGQILVPLEYDGISFLDTGLGFVVERDGKMGLADLRGQVIAPLEFDEIDEFDQLGRFLVVMKDGQRGLLAADGTELLAPHYQSIGRTKDAGVAIIYQDELQGLYDLNAGRFAVPLERGYSSINQLGESDLFVLKRRGNSALYRLADGEILSGAWEMRHLWYDKIAIQMQEDGPFRFYGTDGQLLDDAEYLSVWSDHDTGWVYVKDMDGSAAYLNGDLRRITPQGTSVVFAPTEGGYVVLAAAKDPDRRGMMAPDGKLILPLDFRQVFSMREGLATAQTASGGWGVWDKTGAQILAPDWDGLTQSYDGKMLGAKDGLWRRIDLNGEPVDKRRWSELIFRTRDPLASEPYLIALRQDEATPPRWEVLNFRAERLVEGDFAEIRKKDGRFILTDGAREVAYPPQFDGETIPPPAP